MCTVCRGFTILVMYIAGMGAHNWFCTQMRRRVHNLVSRICAGVGVQDPYINI